MFGQFALYLSLILVGCRPTLISDLVGAINTNVEAYYGPGITDPLATLRLRRCLELVNAILKELSSSKMSAGVKNTRNVCDQPR